MEEELVLTRDLLETRAGLTTVALVVAEGLKNNNQVLIFVDKEDCVRALASEFVINLLDLPEEQGLAVLSSLKLPREKMIDYIKTREEFHSPEE
jgi:DNA polymerase IIIc chi subunit